MDTLVLNHAFQPLDRISWQRAITLWFLDKVEIIEEYDHRDLRSRNLTIKMPAVVRLLRSVVTGKGRPRFSRENVFLRDKGRCQYCRRKLTLKEATYDHVIPRSMGGPTRWDNIVICCFACNQKKGGRTPEQARMQLITEPVRPRSLALSFRFAMRVHLGMPDSWSPYMYGVGGHSTFASD